MKSVVKLPKSIKRLLATMDKQARSHYLKVYVEAIAQDATRSRKAPTPKLDDDQE